MTFPAVAMRLRTFFGMSPKNAGVGWQEALASDQCEAGRECPTTSKALRRDRAFSSLFVMAVSLSIGATGALALGGAPAIWQVGENRIASESALQPWDEYEPRLPTIGYVVRDTSNRRAGQSCHGDN